MKTEQKFEALYNFCGQMEKTLRYDYKKQRLKSQGITYPQFCIVVYSNLIEESKKIFDIKPNKL